MPVKQSGRRGRDRTSVTSGADPGLDVVCRRARQAAPQGMHKPQQHAVAIAADTKARFNLWGKNQGGGWPWWEE